MATVLVIAISVIAATGVWFWMGGLATKQSTVTAPIVIAAQSINCTTEAASTSFNVSALVRNLDVSDDLTEAVYLVGDNGTCGNNSAVGIAAQEQGMVTFDCTTGSVGVTRGGSYTIYAAGAGSATITC